MRRIASLIKRIVLGKSSYTKEELCSFGAKIGNNFDNYGSIDKNHAFLLTIGNDVTLASGATILLHDASTKKSLGFSKVGRVEIGDNVFVGANSIILPNTSIGSNVVIGAGSVVTRDIPDNVVVVGSPARVICTYDSYIEKNKKILETGFVYHTYAPNKTKEEKQQEYEDLKNGGIGLDI